MRDAARDLRPENRAIDGCTRCQHRSDRAPTDLTYNRRVGIAVVTSAFRDDAVAASAVKGTMESEDIDAQLAIKLPCQLVSIVLAIVGSDPSVVTPDDKMGASIVAANYRMEYGLARTSVSHGC